MDEEKRLIARREVGAPNSEIYRIWLGGKIVGTVMLHINGPIPTWDWFLHDPLPSPPGSKQIDGGEPTLDRALAAFRAARNDVEAGPHYSMPEPPRWRHDPTR